MMNALGRCTALGLALCALATPAEAAVTFAFTFTAPLTNGDTASGSGTIVTEDADVNGIYRVVSAAGSFVAYQGEVNARTINAAIGMDANWNVFDATLYTDGQAFVTDGIAFFDDNGPGGIAFYGRTGAGYGGFSGEVGVRAARLTFTPQLSAAVPEPATWAMMTIGFGAMGAAMRRRRVRVAYA